MFRLRDRWGRFGFALATSLIWALPMAAWAGSVDLVGGPGPWIAFGIGAVLLVAWVVLLVRTGSVPVTERHRRYDVHAMSQAERRWNAALVLFGIGLIAFLNGAATVDWGVLTPSLAAGRPGSVALALGLAVFAVVMVFGVILSWSRANAGYQQRRTAT
jgi:membrane protease YdiL (CAAX protease family)